MGRPKKRKLDHAGVNGTINDSGDDDLPSQLVSNIEQDDDGRWFNGGGFGTPIVAPTIDDHDYWPSLDEANAARETQTLHMTSAREVPSLTQRVSDSPSPPLESYNPVPHAQSEPAVMLPNMLPGVGCACLSSMYLSLSNLQSLQECAFPGALHSIREAITTAWNVLHCANCPQQFLTALHNVQMLGMVLMSIAERYHQVMDWIEVEQQRASACDEKLSFQIGNLNGSTTHLHSDDCLGMFNINLDPLEWRRLTKRVVRNEVQGTAITCCSSFVGLLDALVARQKQWHTVSPLVQVPRNVCTAYNAPRIDIAEKDAHCLRLAGEARAMIERLDYD
ncbi:hypothetical protein MBLNU457_5464t1 [Dothideomycetes sp. NU457]